jgi:hypothetical protein
MHGVKTDCAATMQIKAYRCAIPNLLRKQITVILRPLTLNRSVTKHARIFQLHNLKGTKGTFLLILSCVRDQTQSLNWYMDLLSS